MARYADYDYYSNVYMGNVIESSDFDKIEVRASRRIDKICAKLPDCESDSVKLATCAVCDVLSELDFPDYISSETNDGYRVDYNIDGNEVARRVYEAAKIYLDDELLYRGII